MGGTDVRLRRFERRRSVHDTDAFKQGIIRGAVQSAQQWWDREQVA
jgi:hypothetical protein